jgi:hypothetical protein
MATSLSGPSPLHPSQVLVRQAGFQPSPLSPNLRTGLSKSEAEYLLDWLEANGHGPVELSFTDSEGFTISYR